MKKTLCAVIVSIMVACVLGIVAIIIIMRKNKKLNDEIKEENDIEKSE